MKPRLIALVVAAGIVLLAATAFLIVSRQNSQTAADVAGIAEWVRTKGKDSQLGRQFLGPLALGPGDLGPQRSRFKSEIVDEDAGKSAIYAFMLVTVEGREHMLVDRYVPGELVIWWIDRYGAPLTTARREGDDGVVRAVPNEAHADLLKRVMAQMTTLSQQ